MTQARLSKQGWQPIHHGRLNAKREAGSPLPPLGPSSVKEWITSSEAAMRALAPVAVIVGTGDCALGASSDVRWSTVARTRPASPEIAMLQLDVRAKEGPAS